VPAEQPDETLVESFWAVARRLRQLSRQTLAPWEITPSQSRAVSVLQRHGSMRPGELADHLHIVARSATEVVDDLEQRALAERLPDPDDRRATLIRLTGRGEQVATAIRTARDAEAEAFFAGLSRTDRAHLNRILLKLRD
jgi:DNA-binding MarR family transcriptional regulator